MAAVVLFLHNRYRTTGGEERVVADLLWLVREHLHEDAELLERDSATLGRPPAPPPGCSPAACSPATSPPRSGAGRRASSTPTTCCPASAGARWPPRARPARASCCTCTTTAWSAPSAPASRA